MNTPALVRMSLVESSAHLRRALKDAFPGTKFSVRTATTGTSYGWVDVCWTDGPSSDQVEAIARRYDNETFDGMTDSSVRMEPKVATSSIRTTSLHHRFSDEAKARVIADLRTRWTAPYESAFDMAAHSVLSGLREIEAAAHHHLRPIA